MKLFEITTEIIRLDKIVRFSKAKGEERLLDEYHPFSESTYKANPFPYYIKIAFVNGDEMTYKYRIESERNEVFDKLVQALKEEKAE